MVLFASERNDLSKNENLSGKSFGIDLSAQNFSTSVIAGPRNLIYKYGE